MKKARLYFDGGSRGNPGPAAFGIVVIDADGEILVQEGRFIGNATCNEAEYAGVVNGMIAALAAGVTHLEVRGDSKLAVNCAAGRWKCKAKHLKHFHVAAERLRGLFASVRFEHVGRKHNSLCDSLANNAMDAAMSSCRQSVVDEAQLEADAEALGLVPHVETAAPAYSPQVAALLERCKKATA
jgi:ribonuclease HI